MSVSATRWVTVARCLCLGIDMTSDCPGSVLAAAARMIPNAVIVRSMSIQTAPPPYRTIFARLASRPRQENRQADLLVVSGAVTFRVVHGGNLHAARSEFGIGNRHHAVTAVGNCRHQAALAFGDGVQCHAGES